MNLNEAKTFILRLTEELVKRKMDYLLLAGKYAEGLLKNRVFNKGMYSDRGKLGKYISRSWATKRFNAGRQIAYVDLNFTGGLMDSIVVGEDENNVAIYINNDKKYLIARGQEEQRGRIKGIGTIDIWNLTPKEEKEIQKYIEELIDEQIERL